MRVRMQNENPKTKFADCEVVSLWTDPLREWDDDAGESLLGYLVRDPYGEFTFLDGLGQGYRTASWGTTNRLPFDLGKQRSFSAAKWAAMDALFRRHEEQVLESKAWMDMLGSEYGVRWSKKRLDAPDTGEGCE